MWPQAGQVIVAVIWAMPPLRSQFNTRSDLRLKIRRRFAFEIQAGRPGRATEPLELSTKGRAVPAHREVQANRQPPGQRRVIELPGREECGDFPAGHHVIEVQPFLSRHSRSLVRDR